MGSGGGSGAPFFAMSGECPVVITGHVKGRESSDRLGHGSHRKIMGLRPLVENEIERGPLRFGFGSSTVGLAYRSLTSDHSFSSIHSLRPPH